MLSTAILHSFIFTVKQPLPESSREDSIFFENVIQIHLGVGNLELEKNASAEFILLSLTSFIPTNHPQAMSLLPLSFHLLMVKNTMFLVLGITMWEVSSALKIFFMTWYIRKNLISYDALNHITFILYRSYQIYISLDMLWHAF